MKDKLLRAEKYDVGKLDVVGELIKHRMPIHFGGMSDPFSNPGVSKVTKESLIILNDINYPIVLSTKNTNELCKDKTVDILKKINHLVIQITIPFDNAGIAKAYEPNIPTPRERINSVRMLTDEGFYIIVRLQPLIPGLEKETSDNLIPKLGIAGTKHVIVEYLKLPVEKKLSLISDFINITGWKGFEIYEKLHAMRTGREWVLPPKYKWESLQGIINAIHEAGMTYGAGDYGLNHLGDTDCCCGIDKVDGFSRWFKGNISYILRKNQGEFITFEDDTSSYYPLHSIKMYMNSQCREQGVSSVYEYIKSKWNRPGSENSPNTFLGLSWKGDYDKNGNCIYIRNTV